MKKVKEERTSIVEDIRKLALETTNLRPDYESKKSRLVDSSIRGLELKQKYNDMYKQLRECSRMQCRFWCVFDASLCLPSLLISLQRNWSESLTREPSSRNFRRQLSCLNSSQRCAVTHLLHSLLQSPFQGMCYTFTQLTHFFSPTGGDIRTVMYAVHVHVYTCTREVFGISFIHLLVQFLSVFVGGCREFPCW